MHVWALRDARALRGLLAESCWSSTAPRPDRPSAAPRPYRPSCTQAIPAAYCTQTIPAKARVGHLLVQPRCVGESGVGGVLRAEQQLVIGNRSAAHKRANKRPTAKGDGANEINKQTNNQTTNQARPTKPDGLGLIVLSAEKNPNKEGRRTILRITVLRIRAQANGGDPLARLMAPAARCTGRSAQPRGSGGSHCPPAPMHAPAHICARTGVHMHASPRARTPAWTQAHSESRRRCGRSPGADVGPARSRAPCPSPPAAADLQLRDERLQRHTLRRAVAIVRLHRPVSALGRTGGRMMHGPTLPRAHPGSDPSLQRVLRPLRSVAADRSRPIGHGRSVKADRHRPTDARGLACPADVEDRPGRCAQRTERGGDGGGGPYGGFGARESERHAVGVVVGVAELVCIARE